MNESTFLKLKPNEFEDYLNNLFINNNHKASFLEIKSYMRYTINEALKDLSSRISWGRNDNNCTFSVGKLQINLTVHAKKLDEIQQVSRLRYEDVFIPKNVNLTDAIVYAVIPNFSYVPKSNFAAEIKWEKMNTCNHINILNKNMTFADMMDSNYIKELYEKEDNNYEIVKEALHSSIRDTIIRERCIFLDLIQSQEIFDKFKENVQLQNTDLVNNIIKKIFD